MFSMFLFEHSAGWGRISDVLLFSPIYQVRKKVKEEYILHHSGDYLDYKLQISAKIFKSKAKNKFHTDTHSTSTKLTKTNYGCINLFLTLNT